MERINKYFRIRLKANHMIAEVHCTDDFHDLEGKMRIDMTIWKQYLTENKVVYGIQYQALSQLAEDPSTVEYPIVIAKGLHPEKGKDGKFAFLVDFKQDMKKDEEWNFREVMTIPSVNKGQKLAKLVYPEEGTDGKNVMGNVVKAPQGKAIAILRGKNVVFNEADNCYYATENGQLSYSGRKIEVFPEYHVNETLTMKTGNLNFVGSIIIHGDVPTGFTVKADGDIKIFGMVEAATLIAGGSIYISEGIAGQEKGCLKAQGNIQLGYINQAKIFTGNDLYVENSILHSECVVHGHVFSQKGNIIGGTLSAGKTIEVKDIGTKLNTKTEIILGVNKAMADKEQALKKKQKEQEEMLRKLKLLGEKLATQSDHNAKVRIAKLRQKHSMEMVKNELHEIQEELGEMNAEMGDLRDTQLVVRNFIYQNVTVTFGKYKRVMNTDYHYVQFNLFHNEIALQQLF
ncbi:DUF342 domain-containing protein [Oceanobacillus alkalisoli]|uniref:DUF342 domain-containing protein n=1 Tax=Oceanobacillus alkalisoli TaxID=2925113 RepID=UPI001F1203E5|nr:FapA family protein [Oceanobacillus alkalisoli]MCF3942408.1 FapA family protein [Oceanobacillus alkalisoli]